MFEILQSNFEEQFETLETALKTAIFVAIDSEFSGIRSTDDHPSLFDSNADRYKKLKEHVSNYIIIQFGLTAYHYDTITNSYTADVFNVFLVPRSTGIFRDPNVQFQPSCIEFLSRHKFDFNKMASEGIRYVDTHQESILKSHLMSGVLLQKLHESSGIEIKDTLKTTCSQVSKWLATAKVGEEFHLICPEFVEHFFLHYILRKSFPNIWTEKMLDTKQIRLKKVTLETRAKLDHEFGIKALEIEAYQHILGFYRVFSLLSNLTVPVVGHNLLLDLMMSFQQFHEPLPNSYENFKSKLNKVFGSIYDTKFICLELKSKLSSSNKMLWESSLESLYSFLTSKQSDLLAPNPPNIKNEAYCPIEEQTEISAETLVAAKVQCFNGKTLVSSESGEVTGVNAASGILENGVCHASKETNKNDVLEHFHEAGWDSYCAGYVFLRLAHIKAYLQRNQTDENNEVALTWNDLLEAMKLYENKVNISMGKVTHMNLCENDNKKSSCRPPLLHLEVKEGSQLNMEMVQNILAKFGNIDIKQYSHQKAMIAAPTFGCAIDIVRNMKNHPCIKVEVYNPLFHSQLLRFVIGSSAFVSIVSGIVLLAMTWHR